MIEDMASLHITEAELARDVHAVLQKVRKGIEVVIEEDHRAVAIIRSPKQLRKADLGVYRFG